MKYEFWVSTLKYIPPENRILACQLAEGAENLYFMDELDWEKLGVFEPKHIQWMKDAKQSDCWEREWEKLQASDMEMRSFFHPDYPSRLRAIWSPPFSIFIKGTLPTAGKMVSIVGARMCSEYGRSIANKLGETLAVYQVPVISGMALGIDSAAHAGALCGKGQTIAVLGSGCDVCYPRSSRNIYDHILENNGCILSEYPPGTPALRNHFPNRNRIISGLSDAVVVVEAKYKSGSLITATCALEQGRDVFAVPGRIGDILSEGTNDLIAKSGAGMLSNMDEFLEIIGVKEKRRRKVSKKEEKNNSKLSLEKDETLVYSCLDLHPKSVNLIIEETGLHLLTVLDVLGSLKKQNLVQETFQNYFSKTL